MQFKDIIGHKEEIQKLRDIIDRKQLPHALLLHGPSGVGKFRTARAFIQYLCCTDRTPEGDSCGKCPSCIQTAKFNNPDIHYIFPVLKKTNPTRTISADYLQEWIEFLSNHSYMPSDQWLRIIEAGNSRPIIYVAESEEILRLSSLSAYGNGFKIFVIWEPEKMNIEASNKLLKVIEEPFEDTLFLFVSNNPGEIIPTIRSRLRAVEFGRLPDSAIKTFMEERGKSVSEADALARIARGNMNTAFMLTREDGEIDEFRAMFIDAMRAAYARKMPELRNLADKFAAFGREKSIRLLHYFARMIRESFISNLHNDHLKSMTREEEMFVAKFGPFVNSANVEEISSQIDRAVNDISRNANQKIVWFDFLIELCRLIRTNMSSAGK